MRLPRPLCEMLRSLRDIEVDGIGLPAINLDLLNSWQYGNNMSRSRPKSSEQHFSLGLPAPAYQLAERTDREVPSPGLCIASVAATRLPVPTHTDWANGPSSSSVEKNEKWSLIMITAYRVCNGHISTFDASTAFHQQWHTCSTSRAI